MKSQKLGHQMLVTFVQSIFMKAVYPFFLQINSLTLYHTDQTFEKSLKPYENIVGKGENTGDQCFLLVPQQISLFESHFMCSSANAFNLEQV